MTETETTTPRAVEAFEPSRPTLLAGGVLSVWIAILSLPMLSGRFLAGQFSDQYHSGYAFRHWLAEQWKSGGQVPLWNPELFGGMPFVGAMHGDIFYPTSWLRLVLPTGVAMNLGFVVHYLLAGLFAYLFLRLLRVSWGGAVTGGAAYQLSGVIGTYAQPGHDGKLFVTALLPLVLIALVLALRDRRWEGYGLLSIAVGLALVSPHAQLTYYLLIVAGIFALYLTFGERDERPVAGRVLALAGALGAVLLGFGIGLIQILPFYAYLPFSPRAESYYGFEGSTSYAIPWTHVPEFFLSRFTGTTFSQSYWAGNPLKLHSEYLGLPVIALAAMGFRDADRRRIVSWLSGIGALFLLVALGAATPFYRVWYEIMPFVKQTRAPGMALYVVALVLAVLAGFGVQRLERGAGERWAKPLLFAGGGVAILGLIGGVGGIAEALAGGLPPGPGGALPSTAAAAGADAIRFGAFGSGAALALLGLIIWGRNTRRIPPWALPLALALLVGGDLWRNARGFWSYTDPPRSGLYGDDQIKRYLAEQDLPFRAVDLSDTGLDVYRGSSLMAFGIPQLLGHHGNQLHAFNELMGGKNRWIYLLQSRRLWDLYAVRFVLLPAGVDLSAQVPAYANLAQDFDTVLAEVPTSDGGVATLLERRDPIRYARLVPAAIKVEDERAVPTVADPGSRLDFDRLVLLDTAAAVTPAPIESLPPVLDAAVRVTQWAPGRMSLQIEPAAPQDAYVVVSENYYPDWHATVDGVETPVLRGNVSLITVAVPAGAREVRLEFRSADYRVGRSVTLISVLLALGIVVASIGFRRRRRD